MQMYKVMMLPLAEETSLITRIILHLRKKHLKQR